MSIRNSLAMLAATTLLNVCSTPRAQAQEPPQSMDKQAEARLLHAEWGSAMEKVQLPKKGCFTGSYPNREWREVACVAAPDYPMPPRNGPAPLNVGNGIDILAVAPSGTISTTIGSFENLSNVTSESGLVNATGNPVANAYTLQINTNFMQNATICAGAANPATCRVWEQFVFENNNVSHRAFIQYWLIRFGNPCPAGQGWNQRVFNGVIFCFRNNSAGAVATTAQPVTNLANMSLTGSVTATTDRVTFRDGGSMFTVAGDNTVGAAGDWTQSEFNIVGDAGSGQAVFNNGAQMDLRTRIFYGGTAAPGCQSGGTTGETNNLNFGPNRPAQTPPGPAVNFQQSTAGGLLGCAAANTIGDTHLRTFGGLFYDFQASGDFLLVQSDTGFAVQARQVSGAPTWPNASVNSAIATQMGKNRIAVCLESGLNVDGVNQEVADGTNLFTPEGTTIWHVGNVYTIIGPDGDAVRATVNSKYIDVNVGLGHWPANISGLLANVNNSVNVIAGRDGRPISNQWSFEALYRVGDSWRVPEKESLLNVCGGAPKLVGNPARPFFARDLDQETYNRTRAVCVAAGVKGDTLLDACTLDVAVIGDDAAAKVFVDMLPPIAEARPSYTGHGDGGGIKKWWWWILIAILILVIILIWRRRGTP